jgi:hypothetical protein
MSTKPQDHELQRQRSGGDSGIGPGVSADTSSPSPLHPSHAEREPVTYFELQRRSNADPGETPTGNAIPSLPPSSPWHSDPVPPEPTIDRSEDGDVMGTPIDQLP